MPDADSQDDLRTVSVPEPLRPLFLRAQQHVAQYFADRVENPAESTILISGERYILVRAASMSVEFFDLVASLYAGRGTDEATSVASNLLFDIAHALGKADARAFQTRMHLADPVEKLSAGPVHFAHSGWAFVKIGEESTPAPDESFYLVYEHPFSFESDSWMRQGKRSDVPVCVMNSGYSSGWCEESFGLPLVAVEVECLAAGDEHCRFVMAPPSRIQQRLEAWAREKGRTPRHAGSAAVPEFFQRKRMEDELRRSHDELEEKVRDRTRELVVINEKLAAEVAERRAAEGQLRLFESAVEKAVEGILILSAAPDQRGPRILFANEGFVRMSGVAASALRGEPLTALRIVAEEAEIVGRMNEELAQQRPFEGEAVAARGDGGRYVLELRVNPMRDGSGRVTHWVAVLRDITDRKAHLAAIEHQALHDVLTGLPNRVLLLDRVEQAILSAGRANEPLALAIMDLDRFKEVNDTFGHHVGDQLLTQIGPRLRTALRASDTIARLGGDEFAVLLPNCGSADDVAATARKLLQSLDRPFVVEENAFHVGASLGIALFPDHGADSPSLMRRADVAMYLAKQTNAGYSFYSADQDQNSPTRLALMSELRTAIEQDQLVLHYQPKIDLRSGHSVQVEGLVRWNHPRHGLMAPDQFIPLAERTGLIGPLTGWCLNAALQQLRAWLDEGLDIGMAVNLSGRSLQDPQIEDLVRRMLERWNIEPGQLELELTESSVMADPDHGLRVLRSFRDMGVRLSIDDFGTGYSSLAYLQRLPVDEIKIDKSFVIEMSHNLQDEAIVRATIQLCQNLGRKVVAEGVETSGTLDRLRELGCDLAQGFHIARPMPAENLPAWIRNRASELP